MLSIQMADGGLICIRIYKTEESILNRETQSDAPTDADARSELRSEGASASAGSLPPHQTKTRTPHEAR